MTELSRHGGSAGTIDFEFWLPSIDAVFVQELNSPL
jgi:hypothetical protein